MWGNIFSPKSTKNTCRGSIQRDIKPPPPEDYDDIFGGPPRCIFPLKSSVENYPWDDDMFHNSVRHSVKENSRGLPVFQIWSTVSNSGKSREMAGLWGEEFDDQVSRSVLNSEEFSPPISGDEDVYSPVYASKLRPTTVPSTLMHRVQQGFQHVADVPYSGPSFVGKQITENYETHAEYFRSTPFSLSRRASSPESMSRGAYSYSSVKVSVGDEDDCSTQFHHDDDDDDENEISSSNVFKFNYGYKEGADDGVRVDEAIAWAKESYLSRSSSAEMIGMPDVPLVQKQVDESREMKMLEEGIKLWSSGKQRNIELLLSTLQNILWPNSGWCPIAPTNLYESSNVKAAYQKARLRLHPDKLQQRGATLSQKYIAERIFLILQEAWDAYISQDIIISSPE